MTKTEMYDANLQVNFKIFNLNLSYTYQKDPITFFGETKPESEYYVLTVAYYDNY